MSYILQKISYAFLTLLGVVSVIFILFNILPGDPAQMMLGQNEDSKQLEIVKKKYGFDKPISTQYGYYINDLLPVSFHSKTASDYTYLDPNKYSGISLFSISKNTVIALKFPYLRESFTKQGKKVSTIISETLPNTFILSVMAILIAIALGVSLGIISALYKDRWLDHLILQISSLGMSVPSFFSAIIFAWLFGLVWHDITHLEMTGNLFELDDFGEKMNLHLENAILPAIVLGIRPLAVIVQLMRNSLLEVFNQDYIRTARAKGLNELKVIKNHAFKNALNPVVTSVSGWFASMLSGAVFVEYVFGWNGLGKEMVNALNTLDLPVIMGSVLVIALLFITINIFVDLIYAWLDPKVKLI